MARRRPRSTPPAALEARATAPHSAGQLGGEPDQRLGKALVSLLLDHGQAAALHRTGWLAATQDGNRNAGPQRQGQQKHGSDYVITEAHPHYTPGDNLAP